MPGEPRGNLGGTLGGTFPYDFLRDAGGTFGGMPGEPRKTPGEPRKISCHDDFLMDVDIWATSGGTLATSGRHLLGEPGGPGLEHRPHASKNPFRQA